MKSPDKKDSAAAQAAEVAPPPQGLLASGSIIGSYLVRKTLSVDGICELYLVENVYTHTLYALKLLPKSLLETDGDFLARFDKESLVLRESVHHRIVNIHKIGREGDLCYIVMDYVESPESLESLIVRKNGFTERHARKVFTELCEVIDFAHTCRSEPIVHTDLKPSNILFNKNKEMLVSDFPIVGIIGVKYFRDLVKEAAGQKFLETKRLGVETLVQTLNEGDIDRTMTHIFRLKSRTRLAMWKLRKRLSFFSWRRRRALAEQQARQSAAPNRIKYESGLDSYDFMSPEQKAGDPPTTRSNIYSLGQILFRMLSGEKVSGIANLPSEYGCSREWDNIIFKCLQSSPRNRYATVKDLIRDVERVGEAKILRWVFLSLALILGTVSYFVFFQGFHGRELPGLSRMSRVSVEKLDDHAFEEAGIESKTKVGLFVRTIPENASLTIETADGKRKFFSKDKVPAEGLRLFLPPGKYLVSSGKDCYQNLSRIVKVDEKSGELILTLSMSDSLVSVKKYERLKNPASPVHGRPWVLQSLDMELLPVEPGSFVMGFQDETRPRTQDEMEPSERMIKYPFWMASREVSQSQFEELMWFNPSFFISADKRQPVETVSWPEAVEFCRRLTHQERKKNRLPQDYIYRLPTEAEWEYCCRAGVDGSYFYGKNPDVLGEFAWFSQNCGKKANPSGVKKPNSWGFYDMHGNVAEWCLDAHGMPLPVYFVNDPNEIPDKYYLVCRGGAWQDTSEFCRSSARVKISSPARKKATIGFRVVLAPDYESPLGGDVLSAGKVAEK